LNQFELEFHTHTLKYGGLYDHRSDSNCEIWEQLLELWKEAIRHYRLELTTAPDVNIFLINNLNVNACAFTVGQNHYIGIFVGAPMLLNALFREMLSSPDVLPVIGDISKEIRHPKLNHNQLTSVEHYFEASNWKKREVFPKDPLRNQLCQHFETLVMYFLVLHEYTHICNGHVGYSSEISGAAFYIEINMFDNPSFLRNEIRRTLEFDADNTAMSFLLDFILRRTAEGNINGESTNPLFLDPIIGTQFIVFALYSYWRLFDMYIHQWDGSHPPSPVRQSLLIDYILGYHLYTGGEHQLNEMRNRTKATVAEVEFAFSNISHEPYNPFGFLNVQNTEGNSYKINLKRHWNIVRELIEPHAYVAISPSTNI